MLIELVLAVALALFVFSTDLTGGEFLKYSFADALEKKKTKLSKWIHSEWANDNSVLGHQIIDNLNDDEAKFYLSFWKEELGLSPKKKNISKDTQRFLDGLKNKYAN